MMFWIIFIFSLSYKEELTMALQVQVSPGIEFQSLPEVPVYEGSIPLLTKIEWNYIPSVKNHIKSLQEFQTRCPYLGPYTNINTSDILATVQMDTSPHGPILLSDGNVFAWNFHLATRRHVKVTKVNDFIIANITQFSSQLNNYSRFDYFTWNYKQPLINNSCNFNEYQLLLADIKELSAKIQTVNHMCKTRVLNEEVISKPRLHTMITDIKNVLQAIQAQPAFPVSLLDSYYIYELTDCIYSDEHILLDIQVPWVPMNSRIELVKAVPIEYAWKGFTCSIATQEVNIALIVNLGSYEIYKLNCNIHTDSLCLIERFENNLREIFMYRCLQIIVNGGSYSSWNDYCPLDCKPSILTTMQKLKFNTFILSHVPPIKYNCAPFHGELPISTAKIGAIKIVLPCYCQIEVNNIILSTKHPCLLNETYKIKLTYAILPTWFIIQDTHLNPIFTPQLLSITELTTAVNLHWSPPTEWYWNKLYILFISILAISVGISITFQICLFCFVLRKFRLLTHRQATTSGEHTPHINIPLRPRMYPAEDEQGYMIAY
jgi:hypothetical protein